MATKKQVEDEQEYDPAAARRAAHARFAAAQKALGPTAPKIAQNPHFRSGYCPLPDLMAIVRPALEANDLYLTQPLFDTGRDGTVGIQTEVRCSLSGAVVVMGQLVLPCDSTNPQKATAAVTYGRRTGISSIMGIAEADDDGNKATEPKGEKRAGAGAKNGPRQGGDIW